MHEKEYIAALDLGTSKIIAAAGTKKTDKSISVIAFEREESESCIRRGYVYNVEETSKKISAVIKKISAKLPVSLEKIYVGIGGQSLHTEIYSAFRDVEGEVTEELLQSMKKECEAYEPEFSEVFDIVSPEYFLDGKAEKKPMGVSCKKIEVRYQLVLGRPSSKLNLQKCITEKNKIEIAGYIVGPIAVGDVVLTNSEKDLGCALVELGAGVTYLSIYKNGLLKMLITIPLGGNIITKDICDLNILESEAENLKINYGSALTESEEKKISIKLSQPDGIQKNIDKEELNNIIEARTTEIITNVINQIELSGFSASLGAGMIIAGGTAGLKNLVQSIENKTNKKARIAHIEHSVLSDKHYQSLGNEEIIGLLYSGKENCGKHIKPTVKDPEPSIFNADEMKTSPPVAKPTPTSPPGNNNKGENNKNPETPKPQKEKGPGFFDRFKHTVEKKVGVMSKGLFDDEDNNQ